MTSQVSKINKQICEKCEFVRLESFSAPGLCVEITIGQIKFGSWGLSYRYDSRYEEGDLPMAELRDMGMTPEQEMQLLEEVNEMMNFVDDEFSRPAV